jgi:hypothetical protein
VSGRAEAGRFRRCALLGLVAAASLSAGCAIVGDHRVPVAHFTDAQSEGIRPGETTRRDILERLGPPDGVVRDGSPPPMPPGGVGQGAVAYRYDAAECLFTVFLLCGQSGCIPMPTTPVMTTRTLWVFFDERTGAVTRRDVESTSREIQMPEVPWSGDQMH